MKSLPRSSSADQALRRELGSAILSGPLWIGAAVLTGLFLAASLAALTQLIKDRPVDSDRVEVAARIDAIQAGLLEEIGRQSSHGKRESTGIAAAARLEKLTKMFDSVHLHLDPDALWTGTVREGWQRAGNSVLRAAIRARELRSETADPRITGMEVEARAHIVLAVAELRDVASWLRNPPEDVLVSTRQRHFFETAGAIFFATVAAMFLLYLRIVGLSTGAPDVVIIERWAEPAGSPRALVLKMPAPSPRRVPSAIPASGTKAS